MSYIPHNPHVLSVLGLPGGRRFPTEYAVYVGGPRDGELEKLPPEHVGRVTLYEGLAAPYYVTDRVELFPARVAKTAIYALRRRQPCLAAEPVPFLVREGFPE